MSKLSSKDKASIKRYVRAHSSRHKIYQLLSKTYSCSPNLIKRIVDERFNALLIRTTRRNYIKRVFEKNQYLLNNVQKKVLRKRLYKRMLLHEIGKEYGITKERVRQIIMKSLRIIGVKLRFDGYDVT